MENRAKYSCVILHSTQNRVFHLPDWHAFHFQKQDFEHEHGTHAIIKQHRCEIGTSACIMRLLAYKSTVCSPSLFWVVRSSRALCNDAFQKSGCTKKSTQEWECHDCAEQCTKVSLVTKEQTLQMGTQLGKNNQRTKTKWVRPGLEAVYRKKNKIGTGLPVARIHHATAALKATLEDCEKRSPQPQVKPSGEKPPCFYHKTSISLWLHIAEKKQRRLWGPTCGLPTQVLLGSFCKGGHGDHLWTVSMKGRTRVVKNPILYSWYYFSFIALCNRSVLLISLF